MKIKDIFSKDINRNIRRVIDAGDTEQIQNELEEYIITQDIANNIEKILDAYFDLTNDANGVWISAYYGSGKSHLLKMLSVLLENKKITDNKFAMDYFLEKCQGYNETLKGRIRALHNIPSQSVLFNIDHLAKDINRNNQRSVLEVFVTAFNISCGYDSNPYIAHFECSLDTAGQFDNFKNKIFELTNKDWQQVKRQPILYRTKINAAFNQITHQNITDDVLSQYRDEYNENLSINNFAKRVKEYINNKGTTFRVNFFIDEAGQYIHDNAALMLSLQSIAECLNKECRGRSWVFATAQSNLDETLGRQQNINNEEAGRIRDRFYIRIGLTSKDVSEVVKKRLLEKTTQANQELSGLYDREYRNFDVIFNFEESQQYLQIEDKEDFISIYPFVPYQFNLLQKGIIQLAEHDAFQEGIYGSGERSILAVFQDVLKVIQNESVNKLAVVDMMFEVLSPSLKPNFLQPITDAATILQDTFLTRVLRALALVKYNTDFKANVHNITVLLYSDFTENLEELTQKVATALNRLEQEHYIERVEDKYSYLTNKEKDIESEIHRIEISQESITQKLKEIIFDGILGQNRIQYTNGNNFFFTIKIDDIKITPRDYPLTVNILTQIPNDRRLEDISFAKGNELFAYLNDTDTNLLRDLSLILQTNEYVRQNASDDPAMQQILLEKQSQNRRREESVKTHINSILSTIEYFTNGSRIEINANRPIERFRNALYTVIESVYTSILLINAQNYNETDIPTYFNGQENLYNIPATDAEREILNYINIRQYNTTIADVTSYFENPPYGWPLTAIRCIIAQLCARHQLEATENSNVLDNNELCNSIINTRRSTSVLLHSQANLNPVQIRNLKIFYSDCFNIEPEGNNDGRRIAEQVQNKIRAEIDLLQQEYNQTQNYPFSVYFSEALTALKLHNRNDYNYYYKDEFTSAQAGLTGLYRNNITPLRSFIKNNYSIYYNTKKYLQSNSANLKEIDPEISEQINKILNDKDCFKGGNMPTLNQLCEQLRRLLDEKVSQIKQAQIEEIERLETQVKFMPYFSNASNSKQTDVLIAFQQLKNKVNEENQIGLIRDNVAQFMQTKYNELLVALTATEQAPAKHIISLKRLNIGYNKPIITNEQELNDYLNSLKQAIQTALKDNNNISIK